MKKLSDLSLKLGKPAERAFAAAGMTTLDQFARFTENEIAGWHGVGPNALGKIRQALLENDLRFKK
ncbi:hypothetical protein GCM10027299_07730 [Larkinella ripae]